jgi:hypothetical protein
MTIRVIGVPVANIDADRDVAHPRASCFCVIQALINSEINASRGSVLWLISRSR